MTRLFILLGTGTGVGKTHVGERLLQASAADGRSALGFKPVESGIVQRTGSDIERLEHRSSFHVKPPLESQTFALPVSAHLAARKEGRRVNLETIRAEIQRGAASSADLFLVELPGGAFSPLTDNLSGAEFARSIPGARVLLVTVDRLGVLHDVAATTRACAALGLPLHGIVLNAPAEEDASVGTNLAELPTVTAVPVLARFPRSAADAPVAEGDPARTLARLLLR